MALQGMNAAVHVSDFKASESCKFDMTSRRIAKQIGTVS